MAEEQKVIKKKKGGKPHCHVCNETVGLRIDPKTEIMYCPDHPPQR